MAGQTKDGTKKKQLALTCLQFHNAHCAMCTALCIVRGGLCSYCILVICGIFSYEIGEVTLNIWARESYVRGDTQLKLLNCKL